LPETGASARPGAGEAEGLTLPRAVELALAHSPALAEERARLGLAQAELLEAARLPNPTFGYGNLSAHGSAPHPLITASLGIDVAGLFTLPARKHLAEAELDATRRRIAAAALALSADVEHDWYGALAAQSIASVRAVAREAAQTSADTAAKFFEAGKHQRAAAGAGACRGERGRNRACEEPRTRRTRPAWRSRAASGRPARSLPSCSTGRCRRRPPVASIRPRCSRPRGASGSTSRRRTANRRLVSARWSRAAASAGSPTPRSASNASTTATARA
jgi:hypothetical protein